MKVKGKHRELLTELLIYYLNKDNYGVNHNFINEENSTGKYWVNTYIDEYEERVLLLPYPNKKLGIKR